MIKDVEAPLNAALENNSFDLEFRNISYTVPSKVKGSKKTILINVSGRFRKGRLTAILGPSGAGKTSLLKVLSGYKSSDITGSIEIGGEQFNKYDYRRKCALIAQDFQMLPKLTTLETLKVAANLKLTKSVSAMQKIKIINDIVQTLGLRECQHTLVQNLSGGEKKRLSIAVELVTNPPLMLFDEPTSGLDSVSSLQVIKHLRALAHEHNIAIVSIIHQPSSTAFQLFDDVYVLSQGECLYKGPLDDMLDAFDEVGHSCPNYYNRADFALEIASKPRDKRTEELIKKFTNTEFIHGCKKNEGPSNEKTAMLPAMVKRFKISGNHQYPVSFYKQFYVLLMRAFLCTYRDFYFSQLRVIAHIVVGLLIGTVFYNVGNEAGQITTNMSCLFFMLLFIFFGNAMPVILTFPSETRVFQREYSNNWYCVEAYYLAKLCAELPLQLICPILCIVISYYMTGQPMELHRFLLVLGICIIQGLIAQSIGLVAGAVFSLQLGIFFVPAFCIPMLIFSGFFIKVRELFECLRPMAQLSFYKFSFENIIISVLGFDRKKLQCSEDFCYFKWPKNFLNIMDITESNFDWNAIMLVLWYVGLQVCLYVALKMRVRKY